MRKGRPKPLTQQSRSRVSCDVCRSRALYSLLDAAPHLRRVVLIVQREVGRVRCVTAVWSVCRRCDRVLVESRGGCQRALPPNYLPPTANYRPMSATYYPQTANYRRGVEWVW